MGLNLTDGLKLTLMGTQLKILIRHDQNGKTSQK